MVYFHYVGLWQPIVLYIMLVCGSPLCYTLCWFVAAHCAIHYETKNTLLPRWQVCW